MYYNSCGKQTADNAAFRPYCGMSAAQKIRLIALAAVAAACLGACGVNGVDSRSAGTQEPPAMEDIIDRGGTEISDGTGADDESVAPDGMGTPEESAPIDEALKQYHIIVSQADSYQYGEYAETDKPWLELVGYRYALVQMQPDDPIPTLLLEKEIMDTGISVSLSYARVFRYDPDTKTVHQPSEAIGDGGIRGGLSMAGDGDGIMRTEWSGGTGEASVTRITLDGDSISHDTCWTGQVFEMPGSITFHEIEWHEAGDLSALDSWTAPDPGGAGASGPVDSDTLPADGNRIVLMPWNTPEGGRNWLRRIPTQRNL